MTGRLPPPPKPGQLISESSGTHGGSGPVVHAPAMLVLAILALTPAPAAAVSLGEIEIQSGIGNPLRAVIPMHVGDGETLSGYCVNTGGRQIGLRVPRNLKVIAPAAARPGEYQVHVSTPKPLTEPLYEFSIVIDCPDIPVIVRHYTVMLTLPGEAPAEALPAADQVVIATAEPASQTPDEAVAEAEPRPNEPRLDETPIADTAQASTEPRAAAASMLQPGAEYRVREADSLLAISTRVANRPPESVWQVAEMIYTNNPGAFLRRDANMITPGKIIRIPDADELANMTKSDAAARNALSEKAPAPAPEAPTPPQPEALSPEPEPLPVESVAPEPMPIETAVPQPMPLEAASPEPEPVPVEPAMPEPMPVEAAAPEPAPAEIPAPELMPVESVAPQPIPLESAVPEPMPVFTPPAVVRSPVAAPPPAVSELESTLMAVGVGVVLGFLLSLVILRGRLFSAIGGLFRAGKPAAARSAAAKAPESSTKQLAADALISEATEFLGDQADEAFQTNGDYNQNTSVLATLKPDENDASHGTVPIDVPIDTDTAGTVPVGTVPIDAVPIDENVLNDIFADEDAPGEVIDPTASVIPNSFSPADETESAQSFDPTGEVPSIDFADTAAQTQATEHCDPTAELPGLDYADTMAQTQAAEHFDPTAESPSLDAIEPTAVMPRQPLDASHESTAGIQPAAAPAAVAEAPAAEAEDFEFSDSMISKALSEDLDTMEPGDVFSASGKYPEPGEEPAEHLLTGTLTETGLQAIPEDYMENENGIAGSLEDPMLLLETEYEDEFMSSQILEHTAIKKALAKSDDDRPKAEDAEDKETEAAPD